MRQLEKIYLANVLLYIDNIQDIVTFKMINKKCMDVSLMIRYFDQKKRTSQDNKNSCFVPPFLLDCLPSIETIQLKSKQTNTQIIQLLQHIKQIKLPWIYLQNEWTGFLSHIQQNVIELKVELSSKNDFIDLKQFLSLRTLKIRLESMEEDLLYEFLQEETIILKQLFIYCNVLEAKNLLRLKQYKNIQQIIVIIHQDRECQSQQLSPIIQKEIESFAILHTNDYLYDVKYNVQIHDQMNLSELYPKYYFSHCNCQGTVDLRQCEGLTRIQNQSYQPTSVKIDGLQQLKKLYYINEIDTLPSSVTELRIDDTFTIKESQELYSNIKEIIFVMNGKKELIDLRKFHQCDSITIASSHRNQCHFQLPQSLKNFSISGLIQQKLMIEEISQLHQLTSLKIASHLPIPTRQELQLLLNKLPNLEQLYIESFHIEQLTLPTTITKLDLKVERNLNISQLTHLKYLQLHPFLSHPFEELKSFSVIVPNSLYYLNKTKSIHIVNLNEIQLKKYCEN